MQEENQLFKEDVAKDKTLLQLNNWRERAEKFLKNTGFYRNYPLNEFWEKLNVPNMVDILQNSSSETEALRRVQETNCFVVSFYSKTTERAINAQIDYFRYHEPKTWKLLCEIGESPIVENTIKFKRENLHVTLDTFRIAQIAERIFSLFNLNSKKRQIFFELGAGLGHLCRFILCMALDSTYIIADLPISLCFSYLFIKNNFPTKKILLLDSEEDLSLELLNEYDLIFVSVIVINSVKRIPIDVFINTCSLGEMRNETSLAWLSYIENILEPRYVYLLNRFLNHIDDTEEYQWRMIENGHLMHILPQYEVVNFNLEDKYLFGAYFDCMHPRYLELGLIKKKFLHDMKNDQTEKLALEILDQFWLRYYQSYYWAINYRGSSLANDLSKSGALYIHWENARCYPSALSYLLLLLYIDNMNRDNIMPFEESFCLEQLILKYSKNFSHEVRDAIETYISFRQYSRKKALEISSAKERNISISSAADLIETLLRHYNNLKTLNSESVT